MNIDANIWQAFVVCISAVFTQNILLTYFLGLCPFLGVSREVSEIGVYKPGAEFISPEYDGRQAYLFCESMNPELAFSYHVRRADFDEILFRHAASVGVA